MQSTKTQTYKYEHRVYVFLSISVLVTLNGMSSVWPRLQWKKVRRSEINWKYICILSLISSPQQTNTEQYFVVVFFSSYFRRFSLYTTEICHCMYVLVLSNWYTWNWLLFTIQSKWLLAKNNTYMVLALSSHSHVWTNNIQSRLCTNTAASRYTHIQTRIHCFDVSRIWAM